MKDESKMGFPLNLNCNEEILSAPGVFYCHNAWGRTGSPDPEAVWAIGIPFASAQVHICDNKAWQTRHNLYCNITYLIAVYFWYSAIKSEYGARTEWHFPPPHATPIVTSCGAP